MEKISSGNQTDAGVNIPIAKGLLSLDFSHESSYDRLHKYIENRDEETFKKDVGNESHQIVSEFFDNDAYQTIAACIGPQQGVFLTPFFNKEHQIGFQVQYTKVDSNYPSKVEVKIVASDNAKLTPEQEATGGISLTVDENTNPTIILNRKDAKAPVW